MQWGTQDDPSGCPLSVDLLPMVVGSQCHTLIVITSDNNLVYTLSDY